MNDFDHLLSILDSAEDVVAASELRQSFEPTPMRGNYNAGANFQQNCHRSEEGKALLRPKRSAEHRYRLEELVVAYVSQGENVSHFDQQRVSFFPIESSPRTSSYFNESDTCYNIRYNNAESSTNVFASGVPLLEISSVMGSMEEEATSTTRKTDLLFKTDVTTSSADNNNLAMPPQQISPLSTAGSDATFSFCDSRFRSYQVGQWQDRFEELLLFGRSYGQLLVPHCYPPNQKLAQWVKRQRHQYKRKNMGHHSTLSDEREQLLLDAGFVFDSHKAVWYLRFQTLKAFHNVHGHCNIPPDYRDSSLTVWMKHQRRQYLLYQKGLKNTMNEERIQLLDSIGLDWNPRNLVKSCPPAAKSSTPR
jgi:hypothetical protein